ncbi:MAG: polysaccharide deacetylase family protein, partial [Bacillota bacterium]
MYVLRLRWAIAALAVLIAGAFFGGWAAAVLWPQAVMVSLELPVSRGLDMPIFYVRTDQPLVALTFDISWGRQTAGPVLDILKEKGVRATFFLTGFWAKKQRDIAQRIVADGHEVASHGDDHVNLSRY